MNIIVNNLGPIKQASFDFDKRISVFCGPNNTGKTYLSYVLYAFTRQRLLSLEDSLTDAQLKDFFVKQFFLMPIDSEKIFESIVKLEDNMKGNMATVFGISEAVAEQLFADFRIHVDLEKDAYFAYLKEREIDVKVSFKGQSIAKVTKKAGEEVLFVQNISNRIDDNREIVKEELLTQIYKLLVLPAFFSHFFPVERNSLYTYYKDIMANRSQLMDLLQRLENGNRQALIEYITQNSARYPIAVGYSLDAANKMSAVSQEKGYYASLADEIEQEVLGGKLSLTDDGDMKYTSKRAPEKEIPLYLSASMTKSMSGLVHCLRHVAGRYDMIFIDEPEVNCHPDAQILMARIFGKMVNAGIRLVISTHSDYVIRELNNLIMLNNAPESLNEQLKEWGYTKDMAIKSQEMGAYLFTYGVDNKVNVSPIEVNDYGFEVNTIDESINKLNEVSETLYYELRFGDNK